MTELRTVAKTDFNWLLMDISDDEVKEIQMDLLFEKKVLCSQEVVQSFEIRHINKLLDAIEKRLGKKPVKK